MASRFNTIKVLVVGFACAISMSGCAMIGKHVNAYERSTLSKEAEAPFGSRGKKV